MDIKPKVGDIAAFIGGEVVGDKNTVISGLNGIKEAREGDLTFLLSSKNTELLLSTRASCVVVPKETKELSGRSLIKVDSPSIAFSRIVDFIFPDRIPHPKGIHEKAFISHSARIGKNVGVGAYAVVEDGAEIGDNTVIYPLCYVGHKTKIGSGCVLYANVSVREGIFIGNRVIVHSGTVIGSDGFGYDTDKTGMNIKIPQLGTVIIEDDVEIGANVTIDRARLDKTVIGKGSKIDNLVQIAHNVIMGPNCLVAAQTGISGSSKLGRNVVLAGQVGLADHIQLGDFVKAGAQTGISKSFPANTTLFGYPAKPVEKMREIIACIGLLPKLFERVRTLETGTKKKDK